MHLDIDLLVCIIIAAIFLGRLWAVLGTRNENDPQRPNPFSPPPPKPQPGDEAFSSLPSTLSRMKATLPPPNSLAGGLAQVKAAYPAFEEKSFLQEVRDIFSAIVSAYAAANLNNVGEFLSPALLDHFQKAIALRVNAGQTAQTRILRFKDAEAIAAHAEGSQIFITVRFITDQENILKDAKGTLIGGAEGKAEEVSDTWTFQKDSQNPAAKWIVVETKD